MIKLPRSHHDSARSGEHNPACNVALQYAAECLTWISDRLALHKAPRMSGYIIHDDCMGEVNQKELLRAGHKHSLQEVCVTWIYASLFGSAKD